MYEIHDLWPLSLIELYHLSEKNPYIRSLQKAENDAYRLSDGVISILPHADRHIHELGFSDVPFYYVPNGVVSNVPAEDAPENVLCAVQEARSKGKCILMYLGGFSKANALDDLLSVSYTHLDASGSLLRAVRRQSLRLGRPSDTADGDRLARNPLSGGDGRRARR